MGFLDFLKGKGGEPEQAAATVPAILGAPAQGAFMAMDQIPDEVFSTGVLVKAVKALDSAVTIAKADGRPEPILGRENHAL